MCLKKCKWFSRALATLSCIVSGLCTASVGNSVHQVIESPAELSGVPKRVISLSPHLTENVFYLGAGDRLVGVSAHSDYPQAATQLPVVSDFNSVNVELIISLQPDLVLAWEDAGQYSALAQIERAGIRIYRSQPRTLADILIELQSLGKLLHGHQFNSVTVLTPLRDRLLRLDSYSNKDKVSVFYQVWDNPLSTLSNASLIGNMIEICGGSNLFGKQPSVVVQVDREQVVAYNPDVILTSAKAGVTDQAWQRPWQQWQAINAVKFGHMWALPGDLLSRHTARALTGAEQMCDLFDQVRARAVTGE